MNPRLALVARHALEGRTFADIGAGDGQLVSHLLFKGRVGRAIATEVQPGPMARLAERLSGSDGAQLRWGWGLRPLAEGEADTVAVCGMGEAHLLHIVRDRAFFAARIPRLILGPMRGHRRLRRGLCALGLAPSREAVAVQAGRPYVVMVVEGPRRAGPGGPLGSLLPEVDDAGVDVLLRLELERARSLLSARGEDGALRAHLRALEEVSAWRGARRS